MEKVLSIKITPGIFHSSSEKGAKYTVPFEENGKINFKEKFIENLILPLPLEKILISKINYPGKTEINYLDATNIKEYEPAFEIFKGKEPEDLFSKFKGTSAFPNS
jgi:hypothetical protein